LGRVAAVRVRELDYMTRALTELSLIYIDVLYAFGVQQA